MPTITEDELNRLEHLIGKASNLPWANTDTAKELLNVEPDDWWKIYALNGPEEKRCPYHVECSMSQRATEEEMTAARKAYFYPDGDHIMRDPGKSGDNARYIAAACNAVPALIDAVRAQRTAIVAWQFQAAGAALALQRIMSAAQTMREPQQAYEQYGSNEDSVTEAEEVFDGLLEDLRNAMEARNG